MQDKFQIFEPLFDDEKLENDFHMFFQANNLTPLFTNEHRATAITVTYVDARSIINTGGSYHKSLKEFSQILSMANDNKKYEEAVFKILHNTRTFQSMMKKVRKIIDYENHVIWEKHKFNTWNIVFYNKDLL